MTEISESQALAWNTTDVQTDRSNTFSPYYFTGSQAEIYFDDVLIDELTSLYFVEVTNKKPVFGYASPTYSRVACGNRFVQGSFTLNYVDEAYLKVVAQEMLDKKNNSQARLSRPKLRERLGLTGRGDFFRQQALNQIRGLGNLEFRKLASEFRADEASEPILAKRFDSFPPFTIFTLFGDATSTYATHTAGRLVGVTLTSHERVVQAAGQVVQEKYEFIAKEILPRFGD